MSPVCDVKELAGCTDSDYVSVYDHDHDHVHVHVHVRVRVHDHVGFPRG